MAEKSKQAVLPTHHIDEDRDLRNALMVAAVVTVGLALMILTASPQILSLQIAIMETSVLVFVSFAVTMLGLFGLKLNWSTRYISWGIMIFYTIIITLAIHYTGGPLTPLIALYLLIAAAASFLLGRRGATFISLLCIIGYGTILFLEYTYPATWMPPDLWNLSFVPNERGPLLIINWFSLSVPTLMTAQLTGALSERLRRTNVNLMESERLRDNLTHMIVHDLRNPITALMGGLDILLMTLSDKMNEDQKRLLQNARHSNQILLGLVSEILDINKMEAGKFKLHLGKINICELVTENADDMQATAELGEQKITTSLCSTQNVVNCDNHLIGRVVANLLSNALKYTPEGGTVTTKVELVDNQTVKICVNDTGPGIPEDYRQRIFDKFEQIDQKGYSRRGTGLGLTFCKMVVEAHEGEIWVESALGKGSSFCFTLPINGPQTTAVDVKV